VKLDDILGMMIPVAFVFALILESLRPSQKLTEVKNWRWIGAGFFTLIMVLNGVLPLFLPLEWVRAHSLLPGEKLGIVGGVIVGYLSSTFLQYWIHRAQHASPFLWRWTHQLHHSALRVDAAGFVYTHPFEMLITLLYSMVISIFVLGLHPTAIATVGFIPAIAGLVQHVNTRTPKWLEVFAQRPEAHVLHHEFGVHYGNFGDLPIWDKIFKTYRAPRAGQINVGFEPEKAAKLGAMLLGRDVNAQGRP
jgi:sterol desaturase/sphingolipid hydroxylase (fatty acid hydroxylase superfamily)